MLRWRSPPVAALRLATRPSRARERDEAVDVPLANLDLGHPRPCLRRQAVDRELAREQHRRGVHGEHAEAVEAHGPRQDAGGAVHELAHAAAAMHELGQLAADQFGRRRHVRPPSQPGVGPTFGRTLRTWFGCAAGRGSVAPGELEAQERSRAPRPRRPRRSRHPPERVELDVPRRGGPSRQVAKTRPSAIATGRMMPPPGATCFAWLGRHGPVARRPAEQPLVEGGQQPDRALRTGRRRAARARLQALRTSAAGRPDQAAKSSLVAGAWAAA